MARTVTPAWAASRPMVSIGGAGGVTVIGSPSSRGPEDSSPDRPSGVQGPGPRPGQQPDSEAPADGDGEVGPERSAVQQMAQRLDHGRERLVLGEPGHPSGQ